MNLYDFVVEHRHDIVTRARLRIGERIAPIPTEDELSRGVHLFLDDLLRALRPPSVRPPGLRPDRVRPDVVEDDIRPRQPVLRASFTIAQVVYDYGDICQAVTELLAAQHETLEAREFRILNQCLDDAIAGAVTAFARRRDGLVSNRQSDRLRTFAEPLRAQLASARLAFQMIQRGTVGAGGSTGMLLARSLIGLGRSIDYALTMSTLEGPPSREAIELKSLVEEIEVSAVIEARGRGVRWGTSPVARELQADTNRELLRAALTGLVEAAIHQTPRGGLVTLTVRSIATQILIDVTTSGNDVTSTVESEGLELPRQAFQACGGALETARTREGTSYRAILTRTEIAPLAS